MGKGGIAVEFLSLRKGAPESALSSKVFTSRDISKLMVDSDFWNALIGCMQILHTDSGHAIMPQIQERARFFASELPLCSPLSGG